MERLPTDPLRKVCCAWVVALLTASTGALSAECESPAGATELSALVERVRGEGIRNVVVGERHGVGPVKRFAVELANALEASGTSVALYVEGLREDCSIDDPACPSIARAFNEEAYRALIHESRVEVVAIDPALAPERVAHMAARVEEGTSAVRIVLAGNTHVAHAREAGADWWIFGGSVRYPSPGDLARPLLSAPTLTIGWREQTETAAPFVLRRSGCAFDYLLDTAEAADYWFDPSRRSTRLAG